MGRNCKDGIKCLHSEEAVLMLLSHAPLRYSIKEIAGITRFHRNTVRPAVNNLLEEDKIKSIGEGNYKTYYYDTIPDHFRKIANTLYELDMPQLSEIDKLQMIKQMGKKLIADTLKNVLKIDPKTFAHDNLYGAIEHVRMSYLFNDIKVTEDGEVKPLVRFGFDKSEDEINENEFKLKIYPCLCNGEEKYSFACKMVEGALEGGIEGTCGISPDRVSHIKCGNDENGKYCSFNIISNFDKEKKNEIIKQTTQ